MVREVFPLSYELDTLLFSILRFMRRVLRSRKSVAMAIEAPLSVRAAAESQREASREAAVQYLLSRADARRDTRIEEAKRSAALRPTAAERAADAPPRKSAGGSRILDVLA